MSNVIDVDLREFAWSDPVDLFTALHEAAIYTHGLTACPLLPSSYKSPHIDVKRADRKNWQILRPGVFQGADEKQV
jgi:hypothetical protein